MDFSKNQKFVIQVTVVFLIGVLSSLVVNWLEQSAQISATVANWLAIPIGVILVISFLAIWIEALSHALENNRIGWIILLIVFSFVAAFIYAWMEVRKSTKGASPT